MTAFITGSHAYGQPKPDSDIDLVVLLDPNTEDGKILQEQAEQKAPLKYGNLNIIPVSTQERYNGWLETTKQLKSIKEKGVCLTREQAVTYFINNFKAIGISVFEEGTSSGQD